MLFCCEERESIESLICLLREASFSTLITKVLLSEHHTEETHVSSPDNIEKGFTKVETRGTFMALQKFFE